MPAPMPVGGLTMASVALTAAVIGNAYYQKKQFYPSVVYITKSNPSMAAIYLLAFTMVILLGKLLKKVFFGSLRAAEFEHLIERSFYAVTETCLAFTVFRDDFSPKFVALFTVLLFLKAFHWLADYRVDFMERSPVITLLFHIRVTSLLLMLSLLDLVLVNHAYHSTITRGASVQLVFGFEYAILLTVVLNIAVKYACHTVDLQSENPWENKAVYLLYTELVMGFFKVVLYAVFMVIMIRIHTFPLFIIRPMYLTIRSFKKALNDVILSRRAIRNMNTLYPDATSEELAAVDNVCIICREEMIAGAKKLPCGHIFHAACLRSWFQRQQTCPTCRMDILRQTPAAAAAAAPVAQQPAQQQQQEHQREQPGTPPQPQQIPHQQQQQQQPQMPNPFAGLFPMAPGMVMQPFQFPGFQQMQQMHQQQMQQQQQQQQQGAASGTSSAAPASVSRVTATTTTTSNAGAATATNMGPTTLPTQSPPSSGGMSSPAPGVFPAPMMPPFMPFMPFSVPPPQPPLNFAGMSEEELHNLEGNERQNVEARIKVLRNIQTLLDAAVVQMNQYSTIIGSLERSSPPPAVSVTSTTTAAAATVVSSSMTTVTTPSTSSLSEGADSIVGSATTSLVTSISGENPSKTSPEESTIGTSAIRDENASSIQSGTSQTISNSTAFASSSSETASASTDVNHESPEEDPDDPEEIRRRRLERFTATSQQ